MNSHSKKKSYNLKKTSMYKSVVTTGENVVKDATFLYVRMFLKKKYKTNQKDRTEQSIDSELRSRDV